MFWKHIAALAALTLVSTPCAAFDSITQQSPGVMFYFSVPLDARNVKEQKLAVGLSFQGKRDYETVRIDSRMINNFIGGGIEAKWIIVAVVGAGAVAAVATKDKSTANSQQQQQTAAAAASTSDGGGSGSSGNGGTAPCTKPVPTC
jgi:hypothetical protein